jgi:hypothetical protein
MLLVYAVRLIASKEPVGIFWAHNFDDLCISIDEVADTRMCEYTTLSKVGGIIWPEDAKWQMGVSIPMEVAEKMSEDELLAAGPNMDGADFTGEIKDGLPGKRWKPVEQEE